MTTKELIERPPKKLTLIRKVWIEWAKEDAKKISAALRAKETDE